MKLRMLGRIVFFFIIIVGFTIPPTHAQSDSSEKVLTTNLILSTVRSYVGTNYRYGGMSREGVDCSGLMYICFNTGGIELPRTSRDQSKFGKKVDWKKLEPGDLVFFEFKQKGGIVGHSGVIVSVEDDKIKFIHSSSARGVVESDLYSDYYRDNVIGFRRVL